MNDNGTGQSWLAKLPQALSKESLKVKSLLEFRSDSGLSPQRWLRYYLWAFSPRRTDTSFILRRSLLLGLCMLSHASREASLLLSGCVLGMGVCGPRWTVAQACSDSEILPCCPEVFFKAGIVYSSQVKSDSACSGSPSVWSSSIIFPPEAPSQGLFRRLFKNGFFPLLRQCLPILCRVAAMFARPLFSSPPS